MENEFGFKELYSVTLKTTYPIEINGKQLEAGEVIALFDKIQIANFSEIKNIVTAKGGWNNANLVFWETTNQVNLRFNQGIFSKEQLALMTNAKLIQKVDNDNILISKREFLESDEEGNIILTYSAADSIFLYDKATGEKIPYTKLDDIHYKIPTAYKDVIVDYNYIYQNNYSTLQVGHQLTNGFLLFEGKTRVKDDITGQVKTGIIKIPRLKLTSDLSMRLGKNANPVVGQIDAVALPVGERRKEKIMEIYFLDDDIDTDM